MVIGQGLTWMITALTLALLPRYFGPEQMGRVALGLSYADIAATVAGLGMATLVTRELARDREHGAELLGTALWLNAGFGVLAAIAVALAGELAGYDRSTQLVIIALSLTVPFNLISLLAFGALQGLEVMRYQAIFDTFGKLSQLAVTLAVIGFNLSLWAYLGASIACTVTFAIPTMVIVRRHVAYNPRRASLRVARALVLRGIPFCSASVLLVLYLGVDAVLLSVLSGERAVGIYGPASRIFGTLLFAPTIVMTVMFPRLAATAQSELREFSRLAGTALRVVAGITFPVATLTVMMSGPILALLLGGAYEQSAPVMAVLAMALLPTSLNMMAHRVLVALDRQRMWTYVMAVGLAAKILLDLALIELADRMWGNPALGAALGLLVVEAGMTVTAMMLIPATIVDRSLAWYGARLLAAATASAMVVAVMPGHWAMAAAAAAAIYALSTFVLRAYSVSGAAAAARWVMGKGGITPLAALGRSDEAAGTRAPALLFAPERLKAVRTTRR